MFSKPVYDSARKAYSMHVSSDLRFSIDASFDQSFELKEDDKKQLIEFILLHTKGYFSKPLKSSDIQAKLQVKISPERARDQALMRYIFQWKTLEINTVAFTCSLELESKEGIEQPIDLSVFTESNDLDESSCIEVKDVDFPLTQDEPLSVMDAREVEKEKIRMARLRAAKYLLRSEQLYKQYVEKWGEPESEWESSNSESDEE